MSTNLKLENKLQKIYNEKQTNLVPSNIKSGQLIMGIRGNFTDDANAMANTILNNYTAYVNGNKITGNIPTLGTLNYTPSIEVQNIPAGYTTGGTVEAVTNAIDANITPENIVSNINILRSNWRSNSIKSNKFRCNSND